jgi:hypothetical protein
MAAEIGGANPSARRPAGDVPNSKTLYPVEEEAPARPVALETLKPGDHVAGAAAPQIGGRPFTIAVTVETDQPDVVLVAQGGSAAGYALHLRGGRVVFSLRTGSGSALTEVVAAAGVAGPARIIASLGADGTMTLRVNDQPAVTGKAPGLIPRQPQEDFCLGHDNKAPVTHYAGTAPFRGRLTDLKFTSPH